MQAARCQPFDSRDNRSHSSLSMADEVSRTVQPLHSIRHHSQSSLIQRYDSPIIRIYSAPPPTPAPTLRTYRRSYFSPSSPTCAFLAPSPATCFPDTPSLWIRVQIKLKCMNFCSFLFQHFH
uniref:Uncharacterized protein n=1 Tax=Arundo donax TaxID=35708 RepID=A0A0A9R7Q8_ARUDO